MTLMQTVSNTHADFHLEKTEGSNFLGGIFSNRDHLKA